MLHRFRDIASYLSKVADFDPPHLHSAPPVEVCGDLWHQKPWAIVWCCLCDPIRLAVLVEHRLVTYRQTDRRTDRQTQGHG